MTETARPLPAAILRSWKKCGDIGLDRDAKKPLADPLPSHELRQLVQRRELLARRCRPELEALFISTRDRKAIAILTGPEGVILDVAQIT